MGFDFAFDEATRRELAAKLMEVINSNFSSQPNRPVQLPLDQRSFRPLQDKMPEKGEPPMQVLEEICAELIDKGFHVPSANYFGFLFFLPTYAVVLAAPLVVALFLFF